MEQCLESNAADMRERERERREKDIKQLIWFLPQSRSSPVPPFTSNEILTKINLITNAQAHKQEISNAQAQKQEISKQTNYKKMILSCTLHIQSMVFTIENSSDSKTYVFLRYESL